MAALIWFSDSEPISYSSSHFWTCSLRYAGGCFIGSYLCLRYFKFYLGIAALLDAHNNEVGAAASVSKFRQMIRFRVNADGLTGFVIAVRDAETASPGRAPQLAFELIDEFVIHPSPAGESEPSGEPARG